MLACEVPLVPPLSWWFHSVECSLGTGPRTKLKRYSDVIKELKMPDGLEEIFPREIHSESTAIHSESGRIYRDT
jgi:hypothetical protein